MITKLVIEIEDSFETHWQCSVDELAQRIGLLAQATVEAKTEGKIPVVRVKKICRCGNLDCLS